MVGVYGKDFLCAFYVGLCVLREWVVRRAGLDGCFGENGAASGLLGVS